MEGEDGTIYDGLYNSKPKFHKGGRTRRGIGPLKKGQLSKLGYSVKSSLRSRHLAVRRAAKKYGRASTIRKLNAVSVYTRRTSPLKSKRFRADMKFAQTLK